MFETLLIPPASRGHYRRILPVIMISWCDVARTIRILCLEQFRRIVYVFVRGDVATAAAAAVVVMFAAGLAIVAIQQ